MSASSAAAQPPQRVCPRCSTVARTVDPHCPYCGTSYRRRSPVGALVAAVLATVVLVLGGIAGLLVWFGNELDTRINEQVDVVQRDFDRSVTQLEDRIERELDERLSQGSTIPGG
ncbi:MAG TPA: hypothetical protein VN238_13785 [Solirubrobacteraceae bacterium]|nr:hypothetical protein [Solirubrobacteraceae bacterium]